MASSNFWPHPVPLMRSLGQLLIYFFLSFFLPFCLSFFLSFFLYFFLFLCLLLLSFVSCFCLLAFSLACLRMWVGNLHGGLLCYVEHNLFFRWTGRLFALPRYNLTESVVSERSPPHKHTNGQQISAWFVEAAEKCQCSTANGVRRFLGDLQNGCFPVGVP